MGTKIFDLVTLTLKFDLLFKNFNLDHSSLTRRGRDFICAFFVTRPYMGTKIFDLMTLNLKFGLLSKKINLGHSSLTRRGRAFILHMHIPCGKIFPLVPKCFT